MRQIVRDAAAVALTLTLGVGLTACGGSDGDSSPSSTATAANGDVFNDADVQFATDMIQHHAQAVQMVVISQGRPLDPEVRRLAEDIRVTQVPEIEQLVDWLTAWDQEIPETAMDHTNMGHDMHDLGTAMEGMAEMPGGMTAEQMESLQNASDAEFQTRWLEMMIEHHQGAVEMAQDEQEDGTSSDAVALAETIIATQQDEITTMEDLLQ